MLTEKQKNCQYCHGAKRIRDALIYQHSRQILMLESNSLTYTLALRLASEYSNRQYKVSRKIANGLGIVHKPRWRRFTITSRRYRKFMYGQLGPIGINAGGYKQ